MSLRDHGARPHLVLAFFGGEHMGHGEKNVGLTDTRSPGNEPLLVRFGLPKKGQAPLVAMGHAALLCITMGRGISRVLHLDLETSFRTARIKDINKT